MAIDPICGMTVDEATARQTRRNSTTYFFCSESCRQKFLSDGQRQPEPAVSPKRTEFTCPMHSEVRQEGPGNCPKCGMALEPVTADATASDDDPELRDMTQRFWVALALTAPLFMVSMLPMFGL